MAGKVKVFNCPSCGGPINIRAEGRSLAAVCPSCNATLDPNDPNYKILQGAHTASVRTPIIPLGSRCNFDQLYEVIGFMVREDKTGVYEWSEYLLYNPMHGFAWLIESEGNWNFTKMLKSKPEIQSDGSVVYQNHTFRPRTFDEPRVRYVVGEFYWQVQTGDRVSSVDYFSTPYMLTLETADDEETWSFSQPKTPDEIRRAFVGVKIVMPLKTGRGMDPGVSYPEEKGQLVMYTTIALIVLFIFGIVGPVTSGSNAFTGGLAIAFGAYVAFSAVGKTAGDDSDED